MYEQKVSVKAFNFWGKNWCRVSVGTLENMNTFLEAFDRSIM